MSLFKRIINIATLDLRGYTPDALKKIDVINAAEVILPKAASNEFMEAYSLIKVKNIATTIKLDVDENIITMSGVNRIDKSCVEYGATYVLSGISYIEKLDEDKSINIVSSGVITYRQGSNINFLTKSGISYKISDDIKEVKTFSNNVTIDNHFLELIDNTAILCGNSLVFDADVKEETFADKNIIFIAANNIKCNSNISAIVQLKSMARSKILING